MKILQLIQKKQLRGAEVFAAQLSTHLVDQGHDVLIVSLLDGKDQLPFTGNIISLQVSLRKKMFDAWKIDGKVVGAVKSTENLEMRIVFNAGHIIGRDKPL